MRCASRASNGPNHLGLCALQGTVKASLEQALTRILTPKQSLDIVADIHQVTPIAGAGQCWHTAHPTMRWSAGTAGPLHSTANGPTWRQRRHRPLHQRLAHARRRWLRQVTRREKRPFVICFCGVNGVGKSTTLAK